MTDDEWAEIQHRRQHAHRLSIEQVRALVDEVKRLRAELAAREAVIVGARAYAKACEKFANSKFMRMQGYDLSRLEPGARSLYDAIQQYDDDATSGFKHNMAAQAEAFRAGAEALAEWTGERPESWPDFLATNPYKVGAQ